ncbi:MAG: rhodanese-like domain-containing protein [Bacteroidota bacterium]
MYLDIWQTKSETDNLKSVQTFTWILGVTFLLLAPPRFEVSASDAHENGSDQLVSTGWLSEHLQDSSLVILQVGGKEEYETGHIPGAQLLPIMEFIEQSAGGLTHEFPPLEQLVGACESLGVTNTSRIVLYSGSDRIAVVARLYLTLDYLGMGDRTSILDGGLPQWQTENLPLSKEPSERGRSTFHPVLNDSVLVDAAWIMQNLKNPDVVLIDARPESHYIGKSDDHDWDRPGHIAGAFSLPFVNIVSDEVSGRIGDPDRLRDMFLESGAKQGSLIVTYCNTGIWACPVYVAAKYAGYEAHFYDGGYEEWNSDESLPVIAPVRME